MPVRGVERIGPELAISYLTMNPSVFPSRGMVMIIDNLTISAVVVCVVTAAVVIRLLSEPAG